MKPRCITAAGLLHLKFILCHFNELHFYSGIRCLFLYPGHLPVQKIICIQTVCFVFIETD